ncbi:MAG: metallophosphoesterase [Bacteroidales bacterium]|nr:metallophosphoesterase [Bacteroidales bacterium]
MRKLLVIMAAAAALCACGPKLVILHTNDTHSHMDPLRDGRGGIIERAAFVDSVRKADGAGKVLLLHAGDFDQGTSYYSQLHGFLEVDMINAMKYDAVTLGNHEFDDGIESLTERLRLIECPVVCANLDLSSFELGKYVTPYTIVNRGGKKIGIIGLEADISTCVARSISSRIPQLDPVEVTNKWSEYLRNTEKCDMVILLSHHGYYPEDQQYMPQMKGIDLVVGGHSHDFVDDFVYVNDADQKPVPIITDGCWGLEMGVIKVY